MLREAKSEEKLPKECLSCVLWKVGDFGTKDFGKILCFDQCPHRKDKKVGIEKWMSDISKQKKGKDIAQDIHLVTIVAVFIQKQVKDSQINVLD